MNPDWALKLFRRSVLKQNKFRQITRFLGDTRGLRCLDIGSDNGVISYLLRQRGGSWKSADLDETSVQAIRELVGEDVYQVDGTRTPFGDDEFDRIVIVDFLEHIETDRAFILDLFRILKPGGELILNVPHATRSLLRRVRHAMGQTDQRHGHVRPGYTEADLRALVRDEFSLLCVGYYSRFFSQAIDTLMTLALDCTGAAKVARRKGRLIAGNELDRYRKAFALYSLIYPVVWGVAKLDAVAFWSDGYMLIGKAASRKR